MTSAPLPPLMVLTDRSRTGDLETTVAAAVRAGARAVVVREKDLPPPERAAVVGSLDRVVAAAGGRLLVASDLALARRVRSALPGVHLAAGDPWPGDVVRADGTPLLRGRSCHDAAELAAAGREGADYATLSPVFPTPSKPGYGPPLGVGGLARLCRDAPVPVVALGGVTSPEQARACREAGAAGVAVMGAVMAADDPATVVAGLLPAVAAARGAERLG